MQQWQWNGGKKPLPAFGCCFRVCLLVVVRLLLQESQCSEATVNEGASITDTTVASRELSQDVNRSSTGADTVISDTSMAVGADAAASQSCTEQQTSQLAAGAAIDIAWFYHH